MEFMSANSRNLISVLMGKNLYFPWRSQSDVCIIVPYDEWLGFIGSMQPYLRNRGVLSPATILQSDEDIKMRMFLCDIGWAQYSELVFSSNVGKDSTIIIPSFKKADNVGKSDVLDFMYSVGVDAMKKSLDFYKNMDNYYYALFGPNSNGVIRIHYDKLSDFNKEVYYMCLYLCIKGKLERDGNLKKFNIDWR